MSLEQFAGDSAQDIEPPVISSSKDSGQASVSFVKRLRACFWQLFEPTESSAGA